MTDIFIKYGYERILTGLEQGKFFIINKIENSHIEGVFSASNLPSVLAEYNPVSTLEWFDNIEECVESFKELNIF